MRPLYRGKGLWGGGGGGRRAKYREAFVRGVGLGVILNDKCIS